VFLSRSEKPLDRERIRCVAQHRGRYNLSSFMIFADLDLARRLERPEAVAGARYVEALGRLSPDVGARWIEVAGAYAMFAGPASPVTQTFGLGLFAEPTATDLDQLETFFQDRSAPVCHEVSPLAGLLGRTS
jgi:hypothetical protein